MANRPSSQTLNPYVMADIIRAAAAKGDVTMFEPCTCPHCDHEQTHMHLGLESLTCQKCEQRFPSRVPRIPGPGEPMVADYEQALEELAAEHPTAALWLRDRATQLAVER